jgi:putative redox protein
MYPGNPAREMSSPEGTSVRIGAKGYRTEIETGAHTIIADEPIGSGGTDQGACTAMTLRMYADRKQWPLEEVRVQLRHGRNYVEDDRNCEDAPVRLDQIEIDIELTGDLTDEQRARLVEISKKCPVHRTLDSGLRIVLKSESEAGSETVTAEQNQNQSQDQNQSQNQSQKQNQSQNQNQKQ